MGIRKREEIGLGAPLIGLCEKERKRSCSRWMGGKSKEAVFPVGLEGRCFRQHVSQRERRGKGKVKSAW